MGNAKRERGPSGAPLAFRASTNLLLPARRLVAELLEVLLDHVLGRLRQPLDLDRLGGLLDGLLDVPGHLHARRLLERRPGRRPAVQLPPLRVEEPADPLLLALLGQGVLVLRPPPGRPLGVPVRVVLVPGLPL